MVNIGIFEPFLILFLGLIATIIIEVLVAILLNYRAKNEIMIVALASVVTYPVLNLILIIINFFFNLGMVETSFGWTFRIINLIAFFLEFVVVYVEYRILKYSFGHKYSNKRLFLLSFLMNLASYIFGIFVFVPLFS